MAARVALQCVPKAKSAHPKSRPIIEVLGHVRRLTQRCSQRVVGAAVHALQDNANSTFVCVRRWHSQYSFIYTRPLGTMQMHMHNPMEQADD